MQSERGWGRRHPAQHTYQQVWGHGGVELPVGNHGQHQGHTVADELRVEGGRLCPRGQPAPHYTTCSLGTTASLTLRPQRPQVPLGNTCETSGSSGGTSESE